MDTYSNAIMRLKPGANLCWILLTCANAATWASTPVMVQDFENVPTPPTVGVVASLSVDSEKSAAETLGSHVSVVSPAYCTNIKGDTLITLAAPGFKTLMVKCWKQGGALGADSTVGQVTLDAKGRGSFVFPGRCLPAWSHHRENQRRERRRQGQLLPPALQQGRRFLE